jgi:hypothetical protein
LDPINNNGTICRVELTLNYQEYYLEVIFDPVRLTGGSISVEHPKLITTFTLDSYSSSIVSVLIYGCLRDDICDRDFVRDHSLRLLNQNHDLAQHEFTKLLIKRKDFPIKCFTESSKSNLKQCKGEVCNAEIKTEEFIIPKYMINTVQCGAKDKRSTIVRITTSYSDYKKCELQYNIFYTCMYHGCNNKTIVYNVFNITYTFYKSCMVSCDNNHITSTPIDRSLSTVKISMFSQPFNSTIMLNRSFATSIANNVIQDFRMLSILSCSFLSLFLIRDQNSSPYHLD